MTAEETLAEVMIAEARHEKNEVASIADHSQLQTAFNQMRAVFDQIHPEPFHQHAFLRQSDLAVLLPAVKAAAVVLADLNLRMAIVTARRASR